MSSSAKSPAGTGTSSSRPVQGVSSAPRSFSSSARQEAIDGGCSRVEAIVWQQQPQPLEQNHLVAATRALQPLSVDTSPSPDSERQYSGGLYRHVEKLNDGFVPVSELLLSTSKLPASTHISAATHPRADIHQSGGDVKKSSLSPRIADDISRMTTTTSLGSSANALMAGVVSGIGQGISTANTTYSSSALGQVATASGTDALRAGLGSGVGKALDRLAQYYIKLAEQTFPVIEVDAGREIDVVITKGVRIEGIDTAKASPTSYPRRTDPAERTMKVNDDED